jgi:hypothetical protein
MLTLLGREKEKSSERGEALEPSNKHPPQYAVIPSQREPLVQPYAAEKASECECDAHQMVKPASAMGCEQGWHYWQPLYLSVKSTASPWLVVARNRATRKELLTFSDHFLATNKHALSLHIR